MTWRIVCCYCKVVGVGGVGVGGVGVGGVGVGGVGVGGMACHCQVGGC